MNESKMKSKKESDLVSIKKHKLKNRQSDTGAFVSVD